MKIYITGSSGSGATTLGDKVSEQLNIPQEDTDTFFWEPTNPPFTLQRDIVNLHKVYNEFVAQDSFILSGDCLNWGLPKDDLLNHFTHLIFLYVPWEIREKRIRDREIKRFGDRILIGGDMHKTHEDFIEWASHYESERQVGRNLLSQNNFIEQFEKSGGKTLRFEDDFDLEAVLNKSLSFLKGDL